MNILSYYQAIWPVIRQSFTGHARYFVATHKPNLLQRGWNPSTHPLVEVMELPEDLTLPNDLRDRACEGGYELFLPIVGRDNNTILAPFDYEIFLEGQNHRLYTEPAFERDILLQYVKPLSDLLESLFLFHQMPYVIDYTPSGFHQLFLIQRGTRAWKALAAIGYLEDEMVHFIYTRKMGDIKRKCPVDFEAASVFSGIGRLADYISLWLFQRYNEKSLPLPAAICDSLPECVNMDQSWAGDSAIMRCIRTPASAHRKNNDKYGLGGNPLVDVIYSYYDGKVRLSLKKEGGGQLHVAVPDESDLPAVLNAMWNIENAAKIAGQYPGAIPLANDSLVEFIKLYRDSDLYQFHQEFDHKEDLQPGEGVHRFFHDPRLSLDSLGMLYQPVPTFLQPKCLRRFIKNCLAVGWHPKHIGNGICDIYCQNEFHFPFHKYPAETKAKFYARIFSALGLVEQGKLRI